MASRTLLLVAIVSLMDSLMGQHSDTDHGIVMTTQPWNPGSGAQIRSLGFYPHYESGGGSLHGIKFSDTNIQFLSVDVDSYTHTLYLYDYYQRSIAVGYNFTSVMDIEQLSFEFIHAGVSRETCQIAYDWLSQVLYWADPTFNWIAAAPGRKDLIQNDWYKIIVHEHLSSPDGIAVDPIEGLMFWTDTYVNAKIERANLDGTQRRTLFDSGFITPISIEADHTSKQIYWIDHHKNTIESASYEGGSRTTIRRITYAALFDLVVFRDVLMATDIGWNDGMMYILNKTDGADLGTMDFDQYNIQERMYGLAIYSQEHQSKPDKDYCGVLNCEQMCLSKKEGATCTCADGFNLNADSRTCNDTGTYHKAMVLSTGSEICLGDIRAISHHEEYSVKCIFSMLPVATSPPPPPVTQPPSAQTTTAGTHAGSSTSKPKLTSHSSTKSPNKTTAAPIKETTPPTPTLGPDDKITMFDINMVDRIIYFATTHTIYRRAVELTITDSYKEEILTAFKPITGLVYDWIDPGNLYWCNEDSIYVTNVERMKTEVVVKSAGNDTKEVILLPHERKLAWLSGSKDHYEVKTVNLDGTGQQTIAESLSDPIGLTRDQDNKRIYMLNDGTITRVAYNETGPPLTFVQTTGHDIVIYKSYFCIMRTDGDTSYFDSFNRRSLAKMNTGYYNKGLIFTDVKILDVTLQPNEPSPCHHVNGGCEQICSSVFDGGDKAELKCSCTTGYTVDPTDSTACISAIVIDDFILVTDWTYDGIYEITLPTPELPAVVHAVDVQMTGSPTGIIYNHMTNKIVFGDMYDSVIHQANLDGSDTEILMEIGLYAYPNRMDLDETTGNIYYTATYLSHLGIITPRGTNIEKLSTIYGDLLGIVLHPGLGRVYVVVEDYTGSYIMMANMDGTQEEHLIENQPDAANDEAVQMRWPDGIAIDFKANKLYWSDSYYDTISRCELDGTQCKVIFTDKGADIKDIVVDGIYLYYVAWNRDHVTRIALNDTSTKTKIAQNVEMGRLDTLFVYQSSFPNKQPVSQYCIENDGLADCSTICLPTPNGRTCECDYGVELRDDGRTCSDVHQCERTIAFATFPDTCTRRVHDVCDYNCPDNYTPTGTFLVCTGNGWDRQDEVLCKAIPTCPASIDNGQLDAGCSRWYKTTCKMTCSPGYHAERGYLACLDSGKWDLGAVCSEIVCRSDAVVHGYLEDKCIGKAAETCSYSCDKYYTPSSDTSTMKCGADGSWSPSLDTACPVKRCPATVTNGKLLTGCDRTIGGACDYSCDAGYMYQKQTGVHTTVCTESGEWHTNGKSGETCTEAVCSIGTIKHGLFNTGCTGKVNDDCAYSCDDHSVPTQSPASVKCNDKGEWSPDLDTLCADKLCPPTVTNGTISSCTRRIGSACNYSCDTGYQKQPDVLLVVCTDTGQWHTDVTSSAACTAVTCPATFGAVQMDSTCSGQVFSVCDYTCMAPFVHSTSFTMIECKHDGHWDVKEKDLCLASIPRSDAQTGRPNDDGEIAGLAVGVAILAVAIIVIIIVLFMLKRRASKRRSGDASVTFNNGNINGPDIAISNPGYLETKMSAVDGTKTENPYAAVDPNQMQPLRFPTYDSGGPSARQDAGFVNPVYERTQKNAAESLPQYETLDLTGDTIVLTKDSWQKEKAKSVDGIDLKD